MLPGWAQGGADQSKKHQSLSYIVLEKAIQLKDMAHKAEDLMLSYQFSFSYQSSENANMLAEIKSVAQQIAEHAPILKDLGNRTEFSNEIDQLVSASETYANDADSLIPGNATLIEISKVSLDAFLETVDALKAKQSEGFSKATDQVKAASQELSMR